MQSEYRWGEGNKTGMLEFVSGKARTATLGRMGALVGWAPGSDVPSTLSLNMELQSDAKATNPPHGAPCLMGET